MFKSIEAFDSLWFTGSAIYESDVIAPISHCRNMGYEDKDIVIDAVLSGKPELQHKISELLNAFGIGSRYFDIYSYEKRTYGIIRAMRSFPQVQFRYVIGPERDMSNKIVPVELTRFEVNQQIEMGKFDSKSQVQKYDEEHNQKKHSPRVTSSGA